MSKTVYKIMSAIVAFALMFGSYSHASASSVSAPQMAVTTYYVSPTGNDANAGTQAQPWKTLVKANDSVSAGDTVSVQAGTYTQVLTIKKSNLTFIANGKVITKAFEVEGSNNIVRGFTITDPNSKAGIRVYGNNNLIENNEIYYMLEDGMWLGGSGNIIRGNNIHDILAPGKDVNDPHVDCFMAWNDSWWAYEINGLIIENNYCQNPRASGSNQIFILAHNLSSKALKDIVIRGNTFVVAGGGYNPIAFFGDATVTGVQITNNKFYNSNSGANPIYLQNMVGVQVENNTSYGYNGTFVKLVGSTVVQNNNLMYPYGAMSPTPTASAQASITPTATSVPMLPTSTIFVQASATPTAMVLSASLTPIASPIPALPTSTASVVLASPTPTASSIPASPTTRPVQPSVTPTASAVPALPTSTSVQPSATPIATTPTASSIPAFPTATASSVPIVATPTASAPPVLPTSTSVQPTAPAQQQSRSASETKYDDKHGSFVYSSDWRDVSLAQASGGSFKKTGEDGSSVTFTFTGQSFSFIYTSGPAYGQVKVYIDGNLVKTINEYEKTNGYQKRWDYPGQLTLGKHTFKLVTVGNGGTKSSIDAVIVR